jgi:hypothetical protein
MQRYCHPKMVSVRRTSDIRQISGPCCTVATLRMSALGLGRVKNPFGGDAMLDPGAQAMIAAISGLIPTMFITRVRL